MKAPLIMVVLGIGCISGCGDDTTGSSSGGGGSTVTGGGEGGTAGDGGSGGDAPVVCEGTPCAPGQVCSATDTCDGPKSCLDLPPACPPDLWCGCDNNLYMSACDAIALGGGLGTSNCEPPPGYFFCVVNDNVTFCEVATEYCRISGMSGMQFPSCASIPNGCDPATGDCACLMDPCAENCTVSPNTGGTTVICN